MTINYLILTALWTRVNHHRLNHVLEYFLSSNSDLTKMILPKRIQRINRQNPRVCFAQLIYRCLMARFHVAIITSLKWASTSEAMTIKQLEQWEAVFLSGYLVPRLLYFPSWPISFGFLRFFYDIDDFWREITIQTWMKCPVQNNSGWVERLWETFACYEPLYKIIDRSLCKAQKSFPTSSSHCMLDAPDDWLEKKRRQNWHANSDPYA